MVQEKYGVRLATQEKGRLRKVDERVEAPPDSPGPQPGARWS